MSASLEVQQKVTAPPVLSSAPSGSPRSATATLSFGQRQVQEGPVGDYVKTPVVSSTCSFWITPDDGSSAERVISRTYPVEAGQVRRMLNWVDCYGWVKKDIPFHPIFAAQLTQILPGYQIPVSQLFLGAERQSRLYIEFEDPNVHAHLPLVTISPEDGLCIHYPTKSSKDYSGYPKMHADVLQKNNVITALEIVPDHRYGPTLILKNREEWLAMMHKYCVYSEKMLSEFLGRRVRIEYH